MSYTPFVFFGYEIQLPSDNRSRTINMLYDLNVMIKEPFEITCILPTFYPALDEEEYARVVIGFVPDQIDELIDLVNDLKSFIDDSVLLEGRHYFRPFGGRKILYIWEVIEDDMTKAISSTLNQIPMARGGVVHV